MFTNSYRHPAGRMASGWVLLLTAIVLAVGASISGGASAQQDRAPDGFVTGIQGPEDLVQLPGTSWVVVSSSRFLAGAGPGSLRVFDSKRPDIVRTLYPSAKKAKTEEAKRFAPHGLDVRVLGGGRFELLVVNHDGETIDRFTLRASRSRAPRVEHVQRIKLPTHMSPNSVAALPDGDFVVSNMYNPDDPAFVEKFAADQQTGSLLRWSAANEWRSFGPPMSGPNGIVVSKDGKSLYVAEWAGRRVWQIPLDGGQTRSVPVAFLPDNLRWGESGELLLGGQVNTPTRIFSGLGTAPAEIPKGFAVVRVDPDTLGITELFGSGDAGVQGFGFATGALQVGNQIFVGSVLGDRVARYAVPAESRSP